MSEEQIQAEEQRYVPASTVDTMVRTKSSYYKALVAQGWLLPKISSSIVTMEFLHEVRQKKIYCPKLADVKF